MLPVQSKPATGPLPTSVRPARPATPLPAPERRSSRRHTCLATHERLMAAIGDNFVLAKVRNLSPEGISLIMNRPVEAGSILSLDLIDTKTNQFSRTLQVKVVYSVEHPSGDYIMGGSFRSRLTDAEQRQFLALS
jgi:hypothetical protein